MTDKRLLIFGQAVAVVCIVAVIGWAITRGLQHSRETTAQRAQRAAESAEFWRDRVVARICGSVIIYRLRDGRHVLASRSTTPDRVADLETVCGGSK